MRTGQWIAIAGLILLALGAGKTEAGIIAGVISMRTRKKG